MAIISVHLQGMDDSPSYLAYQHLQQWLKGNIIHIDLDFNMMDVPENDWSSRLDRMLESFEFGEYKQ